MNATKAMSQISRQISSVTLSSALMILSALLLLGAAISMAVSSFQSSRRLDRGEIVPALDRASNQFQVERVVANEVLKLRLHPDLTSPEGVLPIDLESSIQKRNDWARWLRVDTECDRPTLKNLDRSDPAFDKWAEWIRIKCGDDFPSLNWAQKFLSRPPYLHPLGGSWARYVSKYIGTPSERKIDLTRLDQGLFTPYLHILETNFKGSTSERVSNGIESRVETLSSSELKDLLSQIRFFSTESHAWIRSTMSDQAWLSVPWGTLKTYLGEAGWEFVPALCGRGQSLIQQDFESCLHELTSTPSGLAGYQNRLAVFGLSLLLVALGLQVRERRQARESDEKSRKLVLQTLAHELRHPATSLQLSLEVLRDQFDTLNDPTQVEFLRMLDQVQRLKRILEASRQYLEANRSDVGGFRFERTSIENFEEFVRHALDSYLEKISIECGPMENGLEKHQWRALALDKYWFSLCLTNLVKNALIHGAKPIRVVVSQSTSATRVEVFDSGPPATLSFEDMIQPMRKSESSPGMGLGLSLVYNLSELMGGRLVYSASPKSFAIEMRNVT